jgi:hypothetical protein
VKANEDCESVRGMKSNKSVYLGDFNNTDVGGMVGEVGGWNYAIDSDPTINLWVGKQLASLNSRKGKRMQVGERSNEEKIVQVVDEVADQDTALHVTSSGAKIHRFRKKS